MGMGMETEMENAAIDRPVGRSGVSASQTDMQKGNELSGEGGGGDIR